MDYMLTLEDSYEKRIVRITEEQKKILSWLDKYGYFESWKDECEGEIIIQEANFIIEDLTK